MKLIRSSKSRKEAHEKLQKYFKLDDEQTNAILEIPLYRLVAMEMEKILQEQKERQSLSSKGFSHAHDFRTFGGMHLVPLLRNTLRNQYLHKVLTDDENWSTNCVISQYERSQFTLI